MVPLFQSPLITVLLLTFNRLIEVFPNPTLSLVSSCHCTFCDNLCISSEVFQPIWTPNTIRITRISVSALLQAFFHCLTSLRSERCLLAYCNTYNGLTSVILCVPFIFADSISCRFGSSMWWLPFIMEVVCIFHSGCFDDWFILLCKADNILSILNDTIVHSTIAFLWCRMQEFTSQYIICNIGIFN